MRKNSHRIPSECWQKVSDNWNCKKDHYITGQDQRKKQRRNWDMTWTLGRELWNRKGSLNLGTPLTGGRSATTGREPPGRKGNKQPAAGRTETDEHRRPVSPMCSATRALADRPWGRTGWLLGSSLKQLECGTGCSQGCTQTEPGPAWEVLPSTGTWRGGPPQQPHSWHAHGRHSSASTSSSEHASVGCPPVYVGPTLEPSPHSCAICGLTLPPLPHRSCKLSICGTPKWVTGAPMAGARLASAAAGFVGTPT